MADKTTMDMAQAEAEKTLDAIEDLERIEQEVVAEAESSVEFEDALGHEQHAAEAAETAFDFDDAEIETEILKGELEEDAA